MLEINKDSNSQVGLVIQRISKGKSIQSVR